MDETKRRDKLDDALLFLIGSISILFGLFQVFLRPSSLPQFIIPVGLLAGVLPFYFGYIRGAIGDSIADRYRGWIFLVIGTASYAYVVLEEAATRLLPDPRLAWVVVLPSLPLLFVAFFQLKRFRSFVLGPTFPRNPVLSQSANYTVRASFVVAIAGGFLSILPYLSIGVLIVVGPLTPFAVYFMWRSSYYAKRIDWTYTLTTKKGRLHDDRGAQLVNKILSNAVLACFLIGSVPLLLIEFAGVQLDLIWAWLGYELFGWGFLLLLPAIALYFLTRSEEAFAFQEP